jgi:hypothetical protein
MIGSESEYCVRVGRHVYPWTVCFISMNWHYANPTKRVGVVPTGPHHRLIENLLVLAMVLLQRMLS